MKWWAYIMCIVLIFSGATCGAVWYDKSRETSGVFGDGFSNELWADLSLLEYHSTGLKLEEGDFTDPDGNTRHGYEYVIEEKAIDFDATRYTYELYFNDFICLDVTASYGIMSGVFPFRFYGSDGSLTCEANVYLTLNCQAMSTKIIVQLFEYDDDNYSLSEQEDAFSDYLDTYGFHVVLRKVS